MDGDSNTFLQSSAVVSDQSISKGPAAKEKIWRVVQKAMDMGCPYLENLEESVVKEILFSDGEARFRTLQWLVGRFHPKLQELLFSSGTSTTSIPILTSLLADTGLCSHGDYELVKGSTSVIRQAKFLGALLDLIELGGWDSVGTELYAPNDRLLGRVKASCEFVDQLCRAEELSVVFPTTLSLIPPGIAKATTLENSVCSEKKQRNLPPSASQLAEQLREMTRQLQSSQAELDQLSQTHIYESLDPVAMENAEKSLLVSLETLSQLSSDFCHTYEAEIQAWTDRQAPVLTPLGPCFKRVCAHGQQVNKLIRSIDLLQTSLKSLETVKRTPHDHCSDAMLQAKEAIKRCLEVIGSWDNVCAE